MGNNEKSVLFWWKYRNNALFSFYTEGYIRGVNLYLAHFPNPQPIGEASV